MSTSPAGTAVTIGASSGIGEALARELDRSGWRLGLLARRLERLEAVRAALSSETVVRGLDVAQPDAAATLEHLLEELGGVDLVIISAGTGHNDPDLLWELDADTVTRERPLSRCTSMACEIWRGSADTLSSLLKSSLAVSTLSC